MFPARTEVNPGDATNNKVPDANGGIPESENYPIIDVSNGESEIAGGLTPRVCKIFPYFFLIHSILIFILLMYKRTTRVWHRHSPLVLTMVLATGSSQQAFFKHLFSQ